MGAEWSPSEVMAMICSLSGHRGAAEVEMPCALPTPALWRVFAVPTQALPGRVWKNPISLTDTALVELLLHEGGIGKFLNTIKTWNTEKQQQVEQAIIIKSLTAQFLCSLGWKHCFPPETSWNHPPLPELLTKSHRNQETAGLRCISSKHSAAASPAFRHILGRKPCVLCGICPAGIKEIHCSCQEL